MNPFIDSLTVQRNILAKWMTFWFQLSALISRFQPMQMNFQCTLAYTHFIQRAHKASQVDTATVTSTKKSKLKIFNWLRESSDTISLKL